LLLGNTVDVIWLLLFGSSALIGWLLFGWLLSLSLSAVVRFGFLLLLLLLPFVVVVVFVHCCSIWYC
jgi:hypothetical protein